MKNTIDLGVTWRDGNEVERTILVAYRTTDGDAGVRNRGAYSDLTPSEQTIRAAVLVDRHGWYSAEPESFSIAHGGHQWDSVSMAVAAWFGRMGDRDPLSAGELLRLRIVEVAEKAAAAADDTPRPVTT